MIPGKKYSDIFWNLVRQSIVLCKILSKPHEEVLKSLEDLSCVKGYAKEDFLVIEYSHFVIVAFRETSAWEPRSDFELDLDAVIDLQIACKRVIEKLKLDTPKPVYFAGHGGAAVTAIFSARRDVTSGVITFGSPEKLCEEGKTRPEFPREAVYGFQLTKDPATEAFPSSSFSQRILIPQNFIEQADYDEVGINRFVEPINRAIYRDWVPQEPPPPLDDVLAELEGKKNKVDIVTLSKQEEYTGPPLISPLKIVVYFHQGDSEIARDYIDSLRLLFDGSATANDGYLAGTSGISGVLRVISGPPCENDTDKIRQYFNDALHTVIIALVDNSLVADPLRMEWLERAAEVANESDAHLVFPIGMYDRAFKEAGNFKNFSGIQRTTTTKLGEDAVQSSYAALLVVHEIYKLLGKSFTDEKRLTIFLSHTKKDGLPLAGAIWAQICQLPGNVHQNSFYDAKSLEPGKPWDEQLRAHAGNCVMLVLRTRLYEASPWCREEFLTAMKEDVPIIVVDARNQGNDPSSNDSSCTDVLQELLLPFNRYPVTHVRDGNLIRVVGLALAEGLRQLMFERDVKQVCDLGISDFDHSRRFRLNSGVEGLMAICRELSGKNNDTTRCRVIYQEPEISDVRAEAFERIIKSFFPLGTLGSCTKIFDELFQCNHAMKTSLSKTVVGISIAEVDGQLAENESNKLTLHAVERLFSHGASVAFGHDWREGGIMEAVYDSMKRSLSAKGNEGEGFRILNLVPWRNGASDSKGKNLARGLKYLEVENTGLPNDSDQTFSQFAKAHPELMKALNAVALSEMRKQLTAKCHARICIGGKLEKSSGAMAGILEEAALAIVNQQPLYLCGHWGGATGAICGMMLGKGDVTPKSFSPSQEVVDQLKELGEAWPLPSPDLKAAFDTISKCSLAQLERTNGLSVEDNKKLFELSDIRQIMSLIIKGLTQRKHQ